MMISRKIVYLEEVDSLILTALDGWTSKMISYQEQEQVKLPDYHSSPIRKMWFSFIFCLFMMCSKSFFFAIFTFSLYSAFGIWHFLRKSFIIEKNTNNARKESFVNLFTAAVSAV